jgi:hypothetical protein
LPRGVAHPPELRAQVVAAVLAGATITEAASAFHIDHSLVSRWVAAGAVQPLAQEKGPTDAELIMQYFRTAIRAMIVQAEVFGDDDYCRSQDADKLAIAHGVLGDKFAGVAATAEALGLIGPLVPSLPALEAATE